MRVAICVLAIPLALAACHKKTSHQVTQTTVVEPPRWHFERIDHGLGDLTLTGVWVRSDGTVFAVGWAGTIITNRVSRTNPDGNWLRMTSGTTENLTAIAGIENGGDFGLTGPEGEIFAVGWNGTVLHYHPNPDGDATTDDGVWQVVAPQTTATGVKRFVSKMKIDPSCPDYDGDGIADDGDRDGFAGDAPCTGSTYSGSCDDNCRTVANGDQRPLIDAPDSTNPANNGCIGPGDSAPPPESVQVDADSDGIGKACDSDDTVATPQTGFSIDLFAVTVIANGTDIDVVAVGGGVAGDEGAAGGAVVTYHGPSAATATASGAGVIDPAAWLAQEGLAYRYDDDCDAATAPGTACANGRLPPACPAQCNPLRTDCSCPVGQGQCCDVNASTGAGCSDGSCGAVANACTAGSCSTLCPTCFRRLDVSLHGVAVDGDRILVVGREGTILEGSLADPSAVWNAPTCTPMPPPLDSHPRLSSVGTNSGGFSAVGAGGALLYYPGGGCAFAPVTSGTTAFLSGVHATGATDGYAVGDGGALFAFHGDTMETLEPKVTENLFSIGTTYSEGFERLWAVGAGGVVVTGAYY